MDTTKATSVMVVNPEQVMTKEVTAIEAKAMAAVVETETDYQLAAGWLSNIKSQQKKVKDFFEPMRKAARATYDSVLGRKKEMLDPLDNAEKVLKGKMAEYMDKQAEKARAREAELRRMAQAEVNKKLEEAIAAEEVGDTFTADFAMTDAQILEESTAGGMLHTPKPKAKNVSHSKSWEITGIDEGKVPVEINGTVIRPVDTKLVMALIKATKGTIKIPGVEYKETVTISVRANN